MHDIPFEWFMLAIGRNEGMRGERARYSWHLITRETEVMEQRHYVLVSEQAKLADSLILYHQALLCYWRLLSADKGE